MAEYIVREALIERLQENFNNRCKADSLCKYVIDKIKTFPAAEVEPVKHGRWIKNELTHIENVFICSLCQRHAFGIYERTPYCPNCGARMEGGADNG